MLTRLSLENFLFLRDTELYFHKGLNAITGETGTGKSLTVSSLLFLIGAEGNYPEGTSVEAELIHKDEELIVRREVRRGKSRYFLNGRGSTKSVISELLSSNLLLQGQNDRIKITRLDFQRDIYDRFAKAMDIRRECEELYQRVVSLEKEIADWNSKRLEREIRVRVLQEGIEEFEALGLTPHSYRELKNRLEELSKAERINQVVAQSLSLLIEEGGIFEKLRALKKLLSQLPEDMLKNFSLLDDTLGELERKLRSLWVSYDQKEIDQLNEKLYSVQTLERKYRKSFEHIYEHVQALKEELESLRSEESIETLEEELKTLRGRLEEVYGALTNRRLSVKGEFEGRVREYLRDMGLERASFKVSFEQREGRYGRESVRFLFSSYRGEERDIGQVASGGEISRLSLALFMLSPPAETYVLDEVDAGISGHTSIKLARLLKELSKSTQLIVVTHSPAIASAADRHFITVRENLGDVPVIRVEELKDGRLEEIARLMGVVSEETLRGAQRLMQEVGSV
ncbi:MAG: DNA recombination protein RecN [Acidobacteria bacterium]|jgi:DNA repair protein RecN (Recombination protein N)|nr:MAG: DNA recombination protein RecN [Acidobacteriota bacterium]